LFKHQKSLDLCGLKIFKEIFKSSKKLICKAELSLKLIRKMPETEKLKKNQSKLPKIKS
jgi:hypothetical protein